MGQTAGGTSYADRGHFPRGRTAANVKGHQKGGHGGVAERLKAPVLKTYAGGFPRLRQVTSTSKIKGSLPSRLRRVTT
jgi:hypothetical protein